MSIEDLKCSRSIRVFLSSTFRDMRAEREELVKKVFPELRLFCAERGIAVSEVDLRWGVTEEQIDRGETLAICLDEIDACRPYFLGILGERYGSLLDHIPPNLRDQHIWLNQYSDRSITELEILFGALNHPDSASRSYFYFRDPKYLSHIPAAERVDYESENAEAQQKLDNLKQRIKNSGLSIRENIANPALIGKAILDDLKRAIEKDFPIDPSLTAIDRERFAHNSFAELRTKVFIGGQQYYQHLDQHIATLDPPLVIQGGPGSGKSALLANWVKHYQTEHEDEFVLVHFVGASDRSTDYHEVMRRIIGEIKQRYALEGEILEDTGALRKAFPSWLSKAAERGRFVLVIDGLDQLDDIDNSRDLIWLPMNIPPAIRLILSSTLGRSIDELSQRNWARLDIQPLSTDERKRFIQDYLNRLYGKNLEATYVSRIASQQAASNPLFLRTLLEELRVFGSYQELPERIETYLMAAGPTELFESVLERLEEDYEAAHSGLVGKAMTALWAARRGLTEDELLKILSVPHLAWSPIYLALRESLVSHSGLLRFFHTALREAVYIKYLSPSGNENATHERLANYFAKGPIDKRVIDELPWQLARAQKWERLKDHLADPEFISTLWTSNQFEAKAYWKQIEDNSQFSCWETYKNVATDPSQIPTLLGPLTDLFNFLHQFDRARHLWERWAQSCQGKNQWNDLATSLAMQAIFQEITGDFDDAIELFRRAEEIWRRLDDVAGIQRALSGQASAKLANQDYEEALTLFESVEEICRNAQDDTNLEKALGNKGQVHHALGRTDRALSVYREQEEICQRIAGLIDDQELTDLGLFDLQKCYYRQALLYKKLGQFSLAKECFNKQRRICLEIGNQDYYRLALFGLVEVCKENEDRDGVIRSFKELARLSRDSGDKAGIVETLGQLGLFHQQQGDVDEALKSYAEQESLCREINHQKWLQACLGNRALILISKGRLDDAFRLLEEKERICRTIDNRFGLQEALGNRAVILRQQSRPIEALMLHREEAQICQEIALSDGLARSLGNQAAAFQDMAQPDEAISLLEQQEEVFRKSGDQDGLQSALGKRGVLLFEKGELDLAMALFEEMASICQEMQNKPGLQVALGEMAGVLKLRGQADAALQLLDKQETICREIHDERNTAIALINKAPIFAQRGQIQYAYAVATEAEEIFARLEAPEAGQARWVLQQLEATLRGRP